MNPRFAFAALLAISLLRTQQVIAEPLSHPLEPHSPSGCVRSDQPVWPQVDAYAKLKSLPPSNSVYQSYRYLVLLILDSCKDGDMLVLSGQEAQDTTAFTKLMSEFCDQSEIASSKTDAVDGEHLVVSRMSCKVSKINSIMGRPASNGHNLAAPGSR